MYIYIYIYYRYFRMKTKKDIVLALGATRVSI